MLFLQQTEFNKPADYMSSPQKILLRVSKSATGAAVMPARAAAVLEMAVVLALPAQGLGKTLDLVSAHPVFPEEAL